MTRDESHGSTTVTTPPWPSFVRWLGFPALGGFLGWFLHTVAGWWAASDSMPLQGLAKLVEDVPETYGMIYFVQGGMVAGFVLAGFVQTKRPLARVSREQVELRLAGSARTIAGADIASAFHDGRELVLLGDDTRELARMPCELDEGRLARAFLAHGHRWRDEDPHADSFREWAPGTDGLPEGADAVLTTRRRALEGDRNEADELRGELARLGVVVRDEGKRQHWRLIASAASGS